jgi:DNA-binding response OmpR family regulator
LDRALKREHLEVLWTATTQEAVTAYNRRHIDLLLLDLNEPVKVGWDIFEPMGALNPALPIVMVTEKKTELEQIVAARVGALLEKPFSLPALIQTIHLLLAEPRKPICKRASAANPHLELFVPVRKDLKRANAAWIAGRETERNQTDRKCYCWTTTSGQLPKKNRITFPTSGAGE